MATKLVQLEVASSTYDLADSLLDVAVAVKTSLDDGLQLDQDLARVLPALMALAGKLGSVKEVAAELKEDPAAFAAALSASVAPGVAKLVAGSESEAV